MTPRATDEVVVRGRSVPVGKTQGCSPLRKTAQPRRHLSETNPRSSLSETNPRRHLSETNPGSSLQNGWFWKHSISKVLSHGQGQSGPCSRLRGLQHERPGKRAALEGLL